MTHKAIGEVRDDLLPCPFCGGSNLSYRFDDIEGWVAYVECHDCDDMTGPMSEFKYQDKDEAAADARERWNRRAALDRSPTVVEEEGASVYTVYDWAWTDETGDEHYARTPERAARLQAEGQNLTPVYTRAAAPPSPSKPEQAPSPVPEAVAWRDETEAEHIARDIKEGRFPARSERQQRPAVADAWERMRDDAELDAARRKLSMHELRRIIKHAIDAHVELSAPSPLSGGDTGKVEVTDAARDVLAERLRQVEAEGWTPKHDDTHRRGELAMAAACYAVGDQIRGKDAIEETATVKAARWRYWPWADEWWKPADRRRNLVKAGALILAEIERLDRAALRTLEGKRT